MNQSSSNHVTGGVDCACVSTKVCQSLLWNVCRLLGWKNPTLFVGDCAGHRLFSDLNSGGVTSWQSIGAAMSFKPGRAHF